jgi:alkylation response protein AidB-like acyl-CoA dehydrogenase
MELWDLKPVTLPPALHALRGEVRAFLAEETAAGRLTPHCDQWLAGWDPAFSSRLGARGWIGMAFPTRYGGSAAGALAQSGSEAGSDADAARVGALAHQVHGAIGFTEEHPLRHSTTRLWAWRDEAGNEEEWSAGLGRHVLDAGADGLWPLITGASA